MFFGFRKVFNYSFKFNMGLRFEFIMVCRFSLEEGCIFTGRCYFGVLGELLGIVKGLDKRKRRKELKEIWKENS